MARSNTCHLNKTNKSNKILILLISLCLIIQVAHAEIRSRSKHKSQNQKHPNGISTDDTADAATLSATKHQHSEEEAETQSAASAATSSHSSSTNKINTDLMDKISWKCANNASCLYSLASGIVSSYRRGDTVKLGFFDLVKLPASVTTNHKSKSNNWSQQNGETGRSMSTFVDFISGNAIRVPVGPMVFSIQRAEDDDNYIEVALLKKATGTARLGGGLLAAGAGGGAADLLGGGGSGGGGGGGGHGILNRFHERKEEKEDKKQMQMYIPMYLAATTFGWTMVAAKFVGILTLKALAISKVAFVVAAMVLMKKLMDNASEKLMYQYPEHSPYMMPYNMDYGMHSMAAQPADMGGAADMYSAGLHAASFASAHQGGGHAGLEHYTAESNVHQNIAEAQNNTQVMAALNAVSLGQKVKREDAWLGRTTTAHRRPLVYNYLNPHSYYRT